MSGLRRLVEGLSGKTKAWLARREDILEFAAAARAFGCRVRAFLADGSNVLPLELPAVSRPLLIRGAGGPMSHFPFLLPGGILPCEALAGFLADHGYKLYTPLSGTPRSPRVFFETPASLLYVERNHVWPALILPIDPGDPCPPWLPLALAVLARVEDGRATAIVGGATLPWSDEEGGWGVSVYAGPGSRAPDLVVAWFFAAGAERVLAGSHRLETLAEALSGWEIAGVDTDEEGRFVCSLERTKRNLAKAEELADGSHRPVLFRPVPRAEAEATAKNTLSLLEEARRLAARGEGQVTVRFADPPHVRTFRPVDFTAKITVREIPWRAVKRVVLLGKPVARVQDRVFVEVPASSVFCDNIAGPFFPVLSPEVPDALLVECCPPVHAAVETGQGLVLLSAFISGSEWGLRQGRKYYMRLSAVSESPEAAREAVRMFVEKCLGDEYPPAEIAVREATETAWETT